MNSKLRNQPEPSKTGLNLRFNFIKKNSAGLYYKDFGSSDISFCAVKKAKPRNAEMVMLFLFLIFFVKKGLSNSCTGFNRLIRFLPDQYKVPVQII